MNDLIEFAERLNQAGDLDPVYEWAYNGSRSLRFIAGYIYFYDCGVAQQLSEVPGDFWPIFSLQYATAPRGKERRHFRGELPLAIVLRQFDGQQPETVLNRLIRESDRSAVKMMDLAKRLPMIGEWSAWKLVDMIDQIILDGGADWSGAQNRMYQKPTEAAISWFGGIDQAMESLAPALSHIKAPPHFNRQYGIPEFETVLCKRGPKGECRYRVGEDLEAMLKQLERAGYEV